LQLQRQYDSFVDNENNSIIADECVENINGKSKRKKKKDNCRNKRKEFSEDENMVKLRPSQERPKRARKAPERFTY
jgi:hypothetical protein